MTAARPLLAVIALALTGFAVRAESVLFVGNSFTFGAYSPTWRYRAASVTDLNNEGIGGVPALFKLFTEEAGLDYTVSLETHPGVGLDWHWTNRLTLLDRLWDHVVMQSYSTLDAAHPGDPTVLSDYAARFEAVFRKQNPAVDVRLAATWSRADLTYRRQSPWTGKTIDTMGRDISCGYRAAAAATPSIKPVIEVGAAFNRAIRTGVADPNPYDGVDFGKVSLWTWDQYHASAFGYYLEALMAFGAVTGRDPTSLGERETAALELGFSPEQTGALQKIAHDQLKTPDERDGCPAQDGIQTSTR